MKRKNIILAVVIASTVLAGTSCSGFLKPLPDNRTEIDNVEKVGKLMGTAYPNASYAGFLEPRCDGMKDYGSPLYSVGDMLSYTIDAYTYSERNRNAMSSDSHDSYWEACYKAIAVSNHALASLKKMNYPANGEGYRAEAYMTRAYAHFNLLTLYSNMFERGKESVNPGIPYVTEPEEVIHKEYDRKTVKSALDNIWTDFERGLRNLPGKSAYDQPKYRFTAESAYAFATRYNLFTQNYAGVLNYANRLIGNPTELETVVDTNGNPILNGDGSVQLIVSPNDIVYKNLAEQLLDRQSFTTISSATNRGRAYTNPEEESNLLVAEVVTTSPIAFMGRAYSRYGMQSSIANTVYSTNVTGGTWNYGVFGVTGDPVGFTPKGSYDFKYNNVVAGTGNYYARIVHFRMEEVLLNRAEAYAMLGDYNSALFDLNMYLQRRITDFNYQTHKITRDKIVEYYKDKIELSESFINSTYNAASFTAANDTYEGKLQRGLILTILDFRRSEFVFEGMRYFDVLRWNIPVEHQIYRGEKITINPDNPNRVLQIPESTSLSGMAKNEYVRFTNEPQFRQFNKKDYEDQQKEEE